MERRNPKSTADIKYAAIVPLIGGFALGNAKATGKKPEYMVSYSAFAANESHIKNYWQDVPFITLDQLDHTPILDKVDFVSSTCPCAGLSMLNASQKADSGKARGSDAAQNQWMYDTIRFVLENIQPRVLMGENAPGLFGAIGEGVVERMKELAEEFGYSLSLVKTDTVFHGVPQVRKRTFYFFWDSEFAPVLGTHQHEAPPLAEYLSRVPTDASLQQSYHSWTLQDLVLYNFLTKEKGITHEQLMDSGNVSIFAYTVNSGLLDESIEWSQQNFPDSNEYRALVHIKEKLMEGKGYWDSSTKLYKNTFNAVISKNMWGAVHPVEPRFLTIREFMHLMGLPHDYELLNPMISYNHIAQNVPVNTAADWTAEVLRYLRGELPSSGQRFFKQDNTARRPEPQKAKILF